MWLHGRIVGKCASSWEVLATERRGADVVCEAYLLGNTLIVLMLQSQAQDGKRLLRDYCSISIRFLIVVRYDYMIIMYVTLIIQRNNSTTTQPTVPFVGLCNMGSLTLWSIIVDRWARAVPPHGVSRSSLSRYRS